MIYIPVSVGELLDKITILEIKKSNIDDLEKLAHIETELSALLSIKNNNIKHNNKLDDLIKQLKKVNAELWDIENLKRNHERLKIFDEEFISLARQVYIKNDIRAQLKKEINVLTNSEIVETKSHF